MRKALAFSFGVLGLTAVVVQVLLLRELLVAFTGNEFFMGWTLGAWLFWVALGALLAGQWGGATWPAIRLLVACHLATALLPPAALVFIRAGRALTGTVPGGVPDLLPALGFALAAPASLCLVLGAQFVWGLRAWSTVVVPVEVPVIPGRAYALETAGFVVGGLLFSVFFAKADEFRVTGLLGGLNLAAGLALGLAFLDRARAWRWAWRTTAVLLAGLVMWSGPLGRATEAWRYPGQDLVEARNSIHGHLAVTKVGRQVNFHANGLLLGTEDEQLASEPLVHYPLLWHPQPRRVLLLGGGFNGALGEILKHAPDSVDYVELDPELIALVRAHAGPARRAVLDDSRIRTVFADGRFFLRSPPGNGPATRYDVILVNLPAPGTLLLNRFYSQEFFRDARRRLAPGGVLALRLAFSPDYLGRELEDLGASLARTLRAEFATVSILPEYDILYLAAEGAAPAAEELVRRHAARALQTDFVIPPAIRDRLATDRIGQVQAAFAANRTAQINRDGRPIACVYTLAYWLRAYHPRAAAVASRLAAAGWPWGGAAAALTVAALAFACRRNPARLGLWAKGFGGFTLLACELVLLSAFQVYCGYLYYKLALILAALMLGMAVGTALGTGRAAGTGWRTLAILHALAAVYTAGLIGFLQYLARAGGSAAGGEWVFLLRAATIGGVAGFEYPVANRIYLNGGNLARRSATVYAVDIAGSGLGALLIGLWALPVLGAETTLGLLAAVNAAVAFFADKEPVKAR